MNAKISIIIPTYNRANLIIETLNSIKAQTYTNWECIIVDDGSSDNTCEVVTDYIKSDSRYQFYKRPDSHKSGGNGARNYGFKYAKGDYINWFDSDDIMMPSFLEKHIENHTNNSNIQLSVCASKVFIDSINNIVDEFVPNQKYDDVCIDLVVGGLYFLTPCSVWKKKFLIDKVLFDEDLLQAQESDFNFRRATEGLKFKFLFDYLVFVRRGHSSIDSSYNRDILTSFYSYFNKLSIYFDSPLKNIDKDLVIFIQNYIHRRKLIRFMELRNYDKRITKDLLLKACSLLKFTLKNEFNIALKIRLMSGILSILFFNKGYTFVKLTDYNLQKK
jgi:glycosyltransferase involved in cell wall biosynthesis